MDEGLTALIAASVAFVGSHFAMSHPLRAPMVSIFGEKLFPLVYSIVSFAALWWMVQAFEGASVGTPLWPGFGDVSWAFAALLTWLAMVLLVGSLTPRNPSLPMPGAKDAARAEPQGVFRVTRHPMMWAFALWAISHLVAAPTARTLVVATAILILALVGARLQDRKKRAQMGEAWAEFERRTSYWPRWERIFSAGLVAWVLGTILWLAASWAHIPLGGQAAGVWRWLV